MTIARARRPPAQAILRAVGRPLVDCSAPCYSEAHIQHFGSLTPNPCIKTGVTLGGRHNRGWSE